MDVDTPDQINAVFDTISYNKGASVIRQLEDFMGTTDFKLGLHNFLEKFAFQNAVTQDLLDELTAVSSDNLNITQVAFEALLKYLQSFSPLVLRL